MKKIFISVFCLLSSVFCFAGLQDTITGAVEDAMPQVTSANTKNVDYVAISKEIQTWIFLFIGVVAVASILYVGAKLLWAPGSTEEVTVALKSLGYIVVGLAIIPFAYFLIKFIIQIRL